jgi:hypothetical protein
MKLNNYLYNFSLILIVAIFIFSSFVKFFNLNAFAFKIAKSEIFYPSLIYPLKYLIPSYEFLLAVFLFFLKNKKFIAIQLISLLTLYSVYKTLLFINGNTCACFNFLPTNFSFGLFLNIFLIFLLFFIYKQNSLSLPNKPKHDK